MSQSHVGGNGSKPESSHLHRASPELSHISRISRDTVSPSYPSPMTSPMSLTHKQDLSLQKGPTAFLTSPMPAGPPSSSLHSRPDAKLEHSGHRSVDMVQLMTVGRQIDQQDGMIFEHHTKEGIGLKPIFSFCCTEISYCMARPVGTEERPGGRPAALCFGQHRAGSALPATHRGRSSATHCPEDEA